MSVFKCLCFVILLTQCQAQTGNPKFRNDYTFVKELNAFYKYDKTLRKWSDAFETCRAHGSEIIVPNSKKEIDKLLELYKGSPDYGVVVSWIAVHDMFAENEFITVDGTPLSESYSNWRPGEPNNYDGKENCVILDVEGEYADVPCDYQVKTICKKPAVNLTENSLCNNYDDEYVYSSQTDRCYKFHTTIATWQKAFKICRDEQTRLAVINSETEAKLFTRMFAQYPASSIKGNFEKDSIFLGFSDFYNPGVYVTIDGQNLNEAGYENWSPGEPSDDNHHCGSMLRDGTLKALDCNTRTMFICEKTLGTTEQRQIKKRPDDQ